MKLRPIALLGLTIFVIPGIAPAQNAVTEWNNIAVKIELAGNSAIPANSPNGMALYLAYVHLAIHDAVNAIEHRYKPFGMPIEVPAGASVDAAVGAAAYTTLQFYFPLQADMLTTQYNGWLAAIPDSGKADGVAAGMAAANQLIIMRAGDGHGAKVPYLYPNVPFCRSSGAQRQRPAYGFRLRKLRRPLRTLRRPLRSRHGWAK